MSQKKTIELLDEIFCIGTNFREQFPEGPVFSDPFDLKEVRELEVGEYEDGSGYWFDYAVPLNGELSDLAAQFKFKKRKKRFAAILHDLHVM